MRRYSTIQGRMVRYFPVTNRSQALAKAKLITLRRDEARAFEQLRAWAGRTNAARFVLAVLASRPVVASESEPELWLVPSASRAGEFHCVDIELRVCDCSGWRYKHTC